VSNQDERFSQRQRPSNGKAPQPRPAPSSRPRPPQEPLSGSPRQSKPSPPRRPSESLRSSRDANYSDDESVYRPGQRKRNSHDDEYEDEGFDSREYARYADESDIHDRRRWQDERSQERPVAKKRSPWDRDWASWSSEMEAYRDDSREWQSQRRSAWGAFPDVLTAASVAVFVTPLNKMRENLKSSAGEAKAWPQIKAWAEAGFAKSAIPTKRVINLMILVSIIGTIFLSGLGLGLMGLNDYRTLYGLANGGTTSLNNVLNDLGLSSSSSKNSGDLTPQQIQQAQTDSAAALRQFTDLSDRLQSPDLLLKVGSGIPGLSGYYQKAVVLSKVAVDGSVILQKFLPALVNVAKVIKTTPISSKGDAANNTPLLDQASLDSIKQSLQNATPDITHMVGLLGNTDPATLTSFLPDKYKKKLLPLLQFVPKIPSAIALTNDFLQIAPTVLGINTNGPVAYLLTTLDNTEIRPVGGFQGQYTVFSVNGGRVGKISLQDVYQTIEINKYVQNYNLPASEAWFGNNGLGYALRNSGLSPDFPTSAKLALKQLASEPLYMKNQYGGYNYLYPEGNHVPITDPTSGSITGYEKTPAHMAGMIAIQPNIIARLMQLTGPIHVGCPYNIDVTADQLQQKIHYYQETDAGRSVGDQGSNGCSANPGSTKRFTATLTQELLVQLKKVSTSDLLNIVLDEFHTKDIQIYLTDPTQKGIAYAPYKGGMDFLRKYNISNEVYQGPATSPDDSLMINQTNFAGDKLNQFMQMKLTDQITLSTSGSATHHLVIGYTFKVPPITVPGTNYLDNEKMIYSVIYNASYDHRYHEYRRLYVHPDAKFISSNGFVDNNNPNNLLSDPLYYGSDVNNRTVFDAYYVYEWEIQPDNTVKFFTPSGVQDVTVDWKVPTSVIKNGQYTLQVQRQSGVDTSIDITISPPSCAKVQQPTHVIQSLTSDTTLTADMTGC